MSEVRLIDANSLKEVLKMSGSLGHIHTLQDVFDQMDIEPTIDPANPRPVARWISSNNGFKIAYQHDMCSACGWWNSKNAKVGKGKTSTKLKYCPNCGAKMED